MPLEGWRQAQQSPAKSIKIRQAVVEISAIEYNIASLIPDTPSTEDSDFPSFDATGTYLIPLDSWCQAQQPPAKYIGIRQAVVE